MAIQAADAAAEAIEMTLKARRLVLSFAMALVWAMKTASAGDSWPTFTPPDAISYGAPEYPPSERFHGREGWVYLNYMIDAQGRPFEPAVVESSGNEAFEKAAMEVVKRWVYKPTTVDNRPSVAMDATKFIFKMNPSDGAGYSFVKRYKALMKAIKADDRAAADAQLAILDVRNLYEDAFVGLGSYQYHKKWGTEEQQLSALKRALARENAVKYLSKVNFVFVLSEMIPLQIKAQDLMGALRSWEMLKKVSADEAAKWQSEIDKIRALRRGGQAHRMPGQLVRSSWQVELLTRRFEVAVSSGRVSDLKVRCERHFVAVPYQPGQQYDIDSQVGSCWLEVIGEPETSLELIQS